ncbi:MAG: hypothetical protein WBB29_11270 [Geitlerinemataceae cyanobacterium]
MKRSYQFLRMSIDEFARNDAIEKTGQERSIELSDLTTAGTLNQKNVKSKALKCKLL